MTKSTDAAARAGLLLVDPSNDFLSERGKLWPRVREVAEPVGLIENLKAIVGTAFGHDISLAAGHVSRRASASPTCH